jgi:DNA-binding protein H-NS
VRTHVELLRQDGTVVLTMTAMNLVRVRPAQVRPADPTAEQARWPGRGRDR